MREPLNCERSVAAIVLSASVTPSGVQGAEATEAAAADDIGEPAGPGGAEPDVAPAPDAAAGPAPAAARAAETPSSSAVRLTYRRIGTWMFIAVLRHLR